MEYQAFKAKYKDILACPLNIQIPEIDTNKLLAWAASNQDCEYQIRKSYGYKGTYEEFQELHKSKLAFFDSYFLLSGSPGNPSTWYKDFNKEFPELAMFVESLPIVGAKLFGFILQKPVSDIKEFNPHAISPIHTDEDNSFGMRMYLNSSKNRMMFYGLREGDMARHTASLVSTKSIDRYHAQDNEGNPLYDNGRPLPHPNFYPVPAPTKFKESNTVFLMSNIMASHYVEHEHEPDKITFILSGRRSVDARYNWDKLDQLIQESLSTRRDEVLHYTDILENNT